MADRSVSMSEQDTKKSNLKLWIAGLVLLLFGLIGFCSLSGQNRWRGVVEDPINTDYTPEGGANPQDPTYPSFGSGTATLQAEPDRVNMTGVVLGSKAEAVITLTARDNAVMLLGLELADNTQENGFTWEGTCRQNAIVAANDTCTLKILWNPTSLRQIQNTLAIRWRANTEVAFEEQTLNIPLTGQSTDSKDCVICESPCKDKDAEKTRSAGLFVGTLGTVSDDMRVVIDDKEYRAEGDLLINPNTKEVVGIVEPEKIPLSLDNKVLGTISKTGDVMAPDGKALGRLLADGTIVDSGLKVLGAAVPMVSVMDEQGRVIGRTVQDGTVVDGTGTVIGRPLVDGTVVNLEGTPVGFLRPYGFVLDLNGDLLGGIVPNGSVVNADLQVVGVVRPNGLVINPDGELIGGVVPYGLAIGAGCRSLGTVLLNGRVRDNFAQIVGHVLLDGTVVDDNGSDLGTVVRQGLVISEKGLIIGFVNSEGKAVDASGTVIGCVNPDGRVTAGAKIVGSVMPKGRVIGRGCQVVGSVYPNGVVMNGAVEVVGQVQADAYVMNAGNQISGVVVPRGAAVAEGCRLLGLMSLDGQVVDNSGMSVGCLSLEKTIVNKQDETIGFLAPQGLVTNSDGKVVGRVRLDGKVVDAAGKVVGCFNTVGTLAQQGGVIIDENGNPTAWNAVGQSVYDENNKKIGTVRANGQVVDEKGYYIGVIPPDGVIFSPEGLVLGRYTRRTGLALSEQQERLGYVLPDLTVINGAKDKIIGTLIPDQTSFMDMNGTYIGTMTVDGVLTGTTGETGGSIRADGTVVSKSGQVIGVRIPRGPVLSVLGREIGTVSDKGEVLSPAQSVIGRVLGNGVAVSADGRVLGGVLTDMALPMGETGLLGGLTEQGRITDARGRMIAAASPFGTVFGLKDNVAGRLVRVGPYVNAEGALVGWTGFRGDMNDTTGTPVATLTLTGLAIGRDNAVVGALVPRGVVVNEKGAYIGVVAADSRVMKPDGTGAGLMGVSPYLTGAENTTGRVLPAGVAVNPEGGFIGWTKWDGTIENGTQTVGTVGLDNRVVQADGTVIGAYMPLGTPLMTDKGFAGVVGEAGTVINDRGEAVATIADNTYAYNKGKIAGRFVNGAMVGLGADGQMMGLVGADGNVAGLNDAKPLGRLMMNGLWMDLAKKVVGSETPIGAAVATGLDTLGMDTAAGQILSGGAVRGRVSGLADGAVFGLDGRILGGLYRPQTFVDKAGSIIGRSAAGSVVVGSDGRKLANVMPFGSVLTSDTVWAGGSLRIGSVVDDDGAALGIVAGTGLVLDKDNAFVGRVLADGSVAGVADQNAYTTMPYLGHVVRQGVPVGYKGSVLGRTTVNGEVIDAADKPAYRILDDGMILGKDLPIAGTVIPFAPAVATDGTVLGVSDGTGTVLNAQQQEVGTVAVNGVVKGRHKYRILGAVLPSALVVNECKVIGQTAYDGSVIDGQGRRVGRMLPNKWVMDTAGNNIGRAVREGFVASQNGDYIGRTLPDSSVVDLSGAVIGCAQNSGLVVSGSGEAIGVVMERGPVLDKTGMMIGRVRHDGMVVNKNGKAIGKVLGDGAGSVADDTGAVIGRMMSPDEELMFAQNGMVSGTFDRNGVFRSPAGRTAFEVWPSGEIVIPQTGRKIADLTDDDKIVDMCGNTLSDVRTVYDAEGVFVGYLTDDDTILNGTCDKIGRWENGTAVDNDGNPIALELIDPEASSVADITGLMGARRINLGGGLIATVTPTGSLVDKNGTIIGYIGDDGRPHAMDGKVIVPGGADDTTPPPAITQTVEVPQEMKDTMDGIRGSRRAAMRNKLNSFARLLPDGRTLARARQKEDLDWGEPKVVSSYPVDMSRMILKDKAIPAVLAHSIDSRYSNVPVTAIVERHIYAEQGRRIIIPAGSRLIGTGGGGGGGKHVEKVTISWTRLIRPDGSAFKLSATSGDAQGRGGIPAYLDEQLLKKYGKPVLTSTLTSAIAFLTATNEDLTIKDNGDQVMSSRTQAANDARSNFVDSMSQIFQQLLEEATETEDVLFVPAGTRLTVYSNEDLWLRSEIEDEQEYDARFGANSKQAQGTSGGNWIAPRASETAAQAAGSVGNGSGETVYDTEDSYYNPDMSESDEPVYDGSDDTADNTAAAAAKPAPTTPQKPRNGQMTNPIFPKQQQTSSKKFI